jgi:hypothetical protein
MKRKAIYLDTELMRIFKQYLEIKYSEDLSQFLRDVQSEIFNDLKEKGYIFLEARLKFFKEDEKKRKAWRKEICKKEGITFKELKRKCEENYGYDNDLPDFYIFLEDILELKENRRNKFKGIEPKEENYSQHGILLNPDHDKVFLEKSRELNFVGYDMFIFYVLMFLWSEMNAAGYKIRRKKELLNVLKNYIKKLDFVRKSRKLTKEILDETYEKIIKEKEKYTFKLKEIKRNKNLHYNYLLDIEDDFKRKEDSNTNPSSMKEYRIKFEGYQRLPLE